MTAPGHVRATWPGLLLTALAGCAVHGPVLEPLATAGRPARVEIDSTPFFPQSQYQCGPAALATALAAAGAPVTADELVPEVYLPGRRGSLQPELVAATRKRDLVPYVLPPSLEALLDTVASGRPVMVLQKLGGGPVPGWHYAVVIGYDTADEVLLLRSGTERRQVMKAGHFLATWDRAERWALAPLPPGELPPGADGARYLEAVAGLEAVGRVAAAATSYAAAAERWPDAALPRLALANIAYAGGDLVEAERGYREAARLDPTAAAPRNNRAEVLRQMGCPAAARRVVEIARQLAAGGPLATAVEETAASIPVTAGPDSPGCPVP